jgi:hypothetical protein
MNQLWRFVDSQHPETGDRANQFRLLTIHKRCRTDAIAT